MIPLNSSLSMCESECRATVAVPVFGVGLSVLFLDQDSTDFVLKQLGVFSPGWESDVHDGVLEVPLSVKLYWLCGEDKKVCTVKIEPTERWKWAKRMGSPT